MQSGCAKNWLAGFVGLIDAWCEFAGFLKLNILLQSFEAWEFLRGLYPGWVKGLETAYCKMGD